MRAAAIWCGVRAASRCRNITNVSAAAAVRRSFSSVATGLTNSNNNNNILSNTQELVFSRDEVQNRAQNANLLRMVTAFRRYGHIVGNLDPLGLEGIKSSSFGEMLDAAPELNPTRYGFGKEDEHREFPLAGLVRIPGRESATLREIVDHLQRSYCGSLCVQYTFMSDGGARRWFADALESIPRDTKTGEAIVSPDAKLRAFRLMHASEKLDHFMHRKFPQVKRYALEGAEAMMPAVDTIISTSVGLGVKETVIGMPHRGRLNLLVGLMNFSPARLFWKVQGHREWSDDLPGIGDVISHIGTSGDIPVGPNKIPTSVSLLQNPSHLEAINPVCLGKVRAKQDLASNFGTAADADQQILSALPLQLHGDAAFYGQGVVAEAFGFSRLNDFSTAGSVHLIVNNQVGFTASAKIGRSSLHSADVGKIVDTPSIHVNAESIGDVVAASELAARYRHEFGQDVIIDLIGYRRHGHNELDEPSFTNPRMYAKIRSKPSIVTDYAAKLEDAGLLTSNDVARWDHEIEDRLQAELARTTSADVEPVAEAFSGRWEGFAPPTDITVPVATGAELKMLKQIGELSVNIPEGEDSIVMHQRLKRTFAKSRLNSLDKNKVDWATAEAMAVGSLLLEGRNVRLCGQDAGRGTFSHRHFEITCQETERRYIPLNHLSDHGARAAGGAEGQGRLVTVNSPLSELAVMGFEYGYSTEDPNTMVLWEAQFGDFVNGAQIIVDTFVTSAESKWLRQSGLVVLLPHGMDGAGPEHSSGRPERFLQACDDTADYPDPQTGIVPGSTVSNINCGKTPNMFICVPTTPANYFHMLRRQMANKFRKPLIVFSPKTLLRNPAAVSSLSEMSPGTKFQPVLPDEGPSSAAEAERVVFCSGKVYYELAALRAKQASAGSSKSARTAIIRLEELCPFPLETLRIEVSKYQPNAEFVWAQEEPRNAGALAYVAPRFAHVLPENSKLNVVARPPLPAPAVGVSDVYKRELSEFLAEAMPE